MDAERVAEYNSVCACGCSMSIYADRTVIQHKPEGWVIKGHPKKIEVCADCFLVHGPGECDR